MTNAELTPIGDALENRFAEIATSDVAGIAHTFEGDSELERIAAYNALSETVSLRDFYGKPIAVTAVVAQTVQVTDPDSGEVSDAPRTVLVGADGTNYHSVSKGVLDSLRMIFRMIGVPSAARPITVVAREVQTRKGYRTVQLSVVPPKK